MTELSRSSVFGPDLAGPIDSDDPNAAKLSIAEMSETFGVTLRALRFYEEKALLQPERKGARRFYGTRDVGRMRVILQAKRLGMTLVEIREIIALLEGRTGRIGQLKELREMCSKQEDLLKEQFAQIEDQVQEMSGVLKALEGLISANDGKA
ncbi:MerR family transcriptional regulator [Stappia sp.]|jgi:DNA-binding transcriptional MerR regulator|uniref:MerR family transcriptional regulator n=1 Tax=Stappia sp. TaxID=1870903 RepID=UPI003A9A2713